MENNKLIAEFMGVDYVDIDTYLENNKELQYHTSWDWLMPVVQKCRLESRCEYDEDDNWNEIHWALEECNLDKIYKAVVEFIKDHNKYICGSCGDHVNEVVFNEDADVDECTNCTEYYER